MNEVSFEVGRFIEIFSDDFGNFYPWQNKLLEIISLNQRFITIQTLPW